MESLSSADKLSAAFADIQNYRQTTATYALNGALQAFQDKDYERAVGQFKRVLSLTPQSADAYKYMAISYSAMGKKDEAIAAFKNAVRLQPNSSSAHKDLGNAYLEAKQWTDAEKEFKDMARIDPTSTYAPYTLGQLYVNTDRIEAAAAQFQKVIALDRKDAHGYYGLGMAYNKMGRYDDAIAVLKQAITIDDSFALAHSELGKAYAAANQDVKAQAEVDTLKTLDPTLADQLGGTIFSPKFITSIYQENSLPTAMGPGTSLAALDESLAAPNAVKDFTMTFQFNTDMDRTSVEDISNWSISRASGGTAGFYNNGIPPETDAEAFVLPMPKSVSYDSSTSQATIIFSVTQNATGDATIDPSHLVFKFSGKDANGKTMSPEGDEYDGFNLTPF